MANSQKTYMLHVMCIKKRNNSQSIQYLQDVAYKHTETFNLWLQFSHECYTTLYDYMMLFYSDSQHFLFAL